MLIFQYFAETKPIGLTSGNLYHCATIKSQVLCHHWNYFVWLIKYCFVGVSIAHSHQYKRNCPYTWSTQLMHILLNGETCVPLDGYFPLRRFTAPTRCQGEYAHHIAASFLRTTPRSGGSSYSLRGELPIWFWSSGKKPELIDYRSLLIKSICNAAVVIQSPHASSWWPFSLYN